MTFSSILSISIALLLSLLMAVIALNVDRISSSIQSQMQLQVSLQPSLSQEQIDRIENQVRYVEGVSQVQFSSRDQELDKLIAENGEMFAQYADANPLYDVLVVDMNPVTQIEEAASEIGKLDGVVDVSFGGSAVKSLISVFGSMRLIGIALAAGLMILSVFLIRNTVRMTILVREDEIGIMRSVGAYNFYIYMPFLLTGIAMGFWGALVPCVIVDAAYVWLYHTLNGVLISNLFTLYPPLPFLLNLTVCTFAAGLLSGALGSFLAVRKLIRRTR